MKNWSLFVAPLLAFSLVKANATEKLSRIDGCEIKYNDASTVVYSASYISSNPGNTLKFSESTVNSPLFSCMIIFKFSYKQDRRINNKES